MLIQRPVSLVTLKFSNKRVDPIKHCRSYQALKEAPFRAVLSQNLSRNNCSYTDVNSNHASKRVNKLSPIADRSYYGSATNFPKRNVLLLKKKRKALQAETSCEYLVNTSDASFGNDSNNSVLNKIRVITSSFAKPLRNTGHYNASKVQLLRKNTRNPSLEEIKLERVLVDDLAKQPERKHKWKSSSMTFLGLHHSAKPYLLSSDKFCEKARKHLSFGGNVSKPFSLGTSFGRDLVLRNPGTKKEEKKPDLKCEELYVQSKKKNIIEKILSLSKQKKQKKIDKKETEPKIIQYKFKIRIKIKKKA